MPKADWVFTFALWKLESMHIAIVLIYSFVSSRERSGWRKILPILVELLTIWLLEKQLMENFR